MVDYQPIAELVKQIPADTWKILQEIQKRRPAMMLDELLDKRERAPTNALWHGCRRCDTMSATGMHHFWRISSPIALSRSRSVRLYYNNACSVTPGPPRSFRFPDDERR